YRDIVVGDFKDSYGNLSLKMSVIISWVVKYCPNVEAMVKVDMDTFVNFELLLALLREIPSKTHPKYVLGAQHRLLQPPVVRTGRWAVSQSMYPYKHFPKYLLGHSYVVSGPALKLMAESFPYFPIIPNEDAFITGIMSRVLNITRFNSHFTNQFSKSFYKRFKNNGLINVINLAYSRGFIWQWIKNKKMCPS
ncbi:hypothetical protein EGW08_017154, partial [Elysia chlorotica]